MDWNHWTLMIGVKWSVVGRLLWPAIPSHTWWVGPIFSEVCLGRLPCGSFYTWQRLRNRRELIVRNVPKGAGRRLYERKGSILAWLIWSIFFKKTLIIILHTFLVFVSSPFLLWRRWDFKLQSPPDHPLAAMFYPFKSMSPGVLSHREPTELGCWAMFFSWLVRLQREVLKSMQIGAHICCFCFYGKIAAPWFWRMKCVGIHTYHNQPPRHFGYKRIFELIHWRPSRYRISLNFNSKSRTDVSCLIVSH